MMALAYDASLRSVTLYITPINGIMPLSWELSMNLSCNNANPETEVETVMGKLLAFN